jgi:hypothetical protein
MKGLYTVRPRLSSVFVLFHIFASLRLCGKNRKNTNAKGQRGKGAKKRETNLPPWVEYVNLGHTLNYATGTPCSIQKSIRLP